MLHSAVVLLVEDNEGDVELTARAFSGHLPSCRLAVANDGEAALELLNEKGAFGNFPLPHLILLDLNMPRMDGKRFLEVVKNNADLRSIPVVMLTSSDSPNDIRECYRRHANCYVVKPFDGRAYSDAVTQVVRFWLDQVALPETH